MEKATSIIFCIVIITASAIVYFPVSHRVFALETDIPLPIIPEPLVETLSLQVDNLNFSFPYQNTTLQIHIGSAYIEGHSESIDENATRTQISLESWDVVMDGPINLKYDSLELQLTITTYSNDLANRLYAEGYVTMPTWQYLWMFLTSLG